jgi:hypothetical protein
MIIFLQQLNQIKTKIKLLKIILYAKNIRKNSINYLDNKCPIYVEDENERTIDFNDIKIENRKILQLIEKINEHNDYNNDSIKIIKIIKNNESYGKL